jgi:hypothetical protein
VAVDLQRQGAGGGRCRREGWNKHGGVESNLDSTVVIPSAHPGKLAGLFRTCPLHFFLADFILPRQTMPPACCVVSSSCYSKTKLASALQLLLSFR